MLRSGVVIWSFVLLDSYIHASFERVIARADVVERAQRSHVVFSVHTSPFCFQDLLVRRTGLSMHACMAQVHRFEKITHFHGSGALRSNAEDPFLRVAISAEQTH